MTLFDLDLSGLRFRTSAEVFGALQGACEANPDLAEFRVIGESEEGRPIAGVRLGVGPRAVSLVAGAHADEPVGPETLRTLVLEGLAARDWGAEAGGLEELFQRFTFRIVPHVNPDGEARNRAWIERWSDDPEDTAETLAAYLRHRRREPPGRDVEFGYPAMRTENAAASAYLFGDGPVAMHASLHGMGFSEGALLLIERDWIDTEAVRSLPEAFTEAAANAGLRLHDHDRGGEKGFEYRGPGFWTTPRGRAMRDHFLDAGDPDTAARFHLSSMETAIEAGADPALGRTPLCVVTELPLFHLGAAYDHAPGVPGLLRRFQAQTPDLLEAVASGQDLAPAIAPLGLRALPLRTQVRLHLGVLDAALAVVTEAAD
ncbi:MAG: M14 family zinc carboxypeptidase [Bacteroidota bacterium]